MSYYHGSPVALGQGICMICGELYESGEVLIHKRLQNIKEGQNITGYGLCPEHKKLHEDGYLILIECEGTAIAHTLKFEKPNRTGKIMYIKYDVFNQIMTNPINKEDYSFIFVQEGVIDEIFALQQIGESDVETDK